MTAFQPRVIHKSDPRGVAIEWTDGHRTHFSAAQLRSICPCARCIDEVSGRRILEPASIPQDLTQTQVSLVGNYAISVAFSDGHATGIYPFRFLRDRDPES